MKCESVEKSKEGRDRLAQRTAVGTRSGRGRRGAARAVPKRKMSEKKERVETHRATGRKGSDNASERRVPGIRSRRLVVVEALGVTRGGASGVESFQTCSTGSTFFSGSAPTLT